MQFDIAPALPPDAPGLAALLAQALPPGWPASDVAASCVSANRAVLKATEGGAPLGLAILQFAADEAEILTIAVAEEARRMGAGSVLLDAALEICREKLISCVYLEVAMGNSAALKLYARFGFCEIARRQNYYQAARLVPETALIMRLDMKCGVTQIDRQTGRT